MNQMRRISRLIASLTLALSAALAQNAHPTFDAASVKIYVKGPIVPGLLQMKGGPGTSEPGRMRWGLTTLQQLIMKAWDVEEYRIISRTPLIARGPSYAIEVTMPPETTKAEFRLMLQNLLIERFQLRLHHENRMLPGYELVVAPGDPKLKQSADPDAPDPIFGASGERDPDGFLVLPPGHGSAIGMGPDGEQVTAKSYTIPDFIADRLRHFVSGSDGSPRYIADKTGLTGKYDFKLKFNPRLGNVTIGPVGAATSMNFDNGSFPDIFTAVQKQLGLRLVKSKGFLLDTLVIDHIETIPTSN